MSGYSTAAPSALGGRHVLIGFVAFFSVVAAANGAFIYAALSTYTGVVANEPYRKGLKYNERIAADEQQRALGWTDMLSLDIDRRALTLILRDANGELVTGLAITGKLGRPATETSDQAVQFSEVEPGRYQAGLNQLAPGSWIVDLDAGRSSAGNEVLFRLRERLWLKP